MGAIASQIASLAIVYSAVYSDADQRKHQSSASLAFVRGIHRGPVNSPHKWPVTRKMFPFDDVIRNGKIWNHPDWRKASFNFINCSFILIFIWGQMVWNYHVCTVIVVKTDLKTHQEIPIPLRFINPIPNSVSSDTDCVCVWPSTEQILEITCTFY